MTQNEVDSQNEKYEQGKARLNEWQFRISWRGCLVLQRKIKWKGMAQDYLNWEDATVGDLRDYYAMHQCNK